MLDDAFVSIQGVSKTYPTRDGPLSAVDGVSLDFGRGDFVAVLGPSGCGKSTLMLMLAGLIGRTAGTISIDGTLVDRPYTNLGIVFQDPVLLDWRNVLDNLMLQAEIRALDRQAMRARARTLLSMVGLEGFEQRHPWELSGGMRQRVSICRALVHDPPLLLMDEPFGALDAMTRDQLNLDLQDIWLSHRKTVMFITHSIPEAVFLADRVIVMSPRPGRIASAIEVDLPRPRHLGVRETPAFGRYTGQIRALFEGWGVLREHDDAGATVSAA
jgi:NitT/TauT family transport system ATP-binding protein